MFAFLVETRVAFLSTHNALDRDRGQSQRPRPRRVCSLLPALMGPRGPEKAPLVGKQSLAYSERRAEFFKGAVSCSEVFPPFSTQRHSKRYLARGGRAARVLVPSRVGVHPTPAIPSLSPPILFIFSFSSPFHFGS